jgi:hypothetical protein
MWRKIKNISADVQDWRYGLTVDHWDEESKPLRMAHRLPGQDWVVADTADISQNRAFWTVKAVDVRMKPGEEIELEYEWQESKGPDDVVDDNLVAPTTDPLIVVDAPPDFWVMVAFAGHGEGIRSPGGAFRMRDAEHGAVLASDQYIRIRWRPKDSPDRGTEDSQPQSA